MSQFWFYFNLGLHHVLDWDAYDHILFLIVLIAAYSFSSWIKVFWLVTVFTLGHTVSLFLSVYDIISVNTRWVELLIAVTILITAFYNIFTAKKKESQRHTGVLYFATAFFGIIHGLGFSTYFKMIIAGADSKFLPLLEFALGIEVAKLIVALAVLILAFIFQNIIQFSRRDWILVVSSIVIGMLFPVLLETIQAIW